MADPSDIFRGVQRHQPLTLAPFLEFGSGSYTEDPPTLLSLDLFHRRRSPDPSPLSSPDPDPDFLGLGLGLELGLGFPYQEDEERHREQEQEDQEDWTGDEFFIGRRSSGGGPEFSRARFIDEDGLRILGFESDSDPDEQIIAIGSDPIPEDPCLPLCWDCLRIDDDDQRDPTASNAEDFEWEEIDGRADIVSNMIREEEYQEELSFGDEESHYRIQELGPEEEEDEVARRTGIEWEVLLTMHHLGTESYYVEEEEEEAHDIEDGFVYTSEYDDVLFGQFQEHDSSPKVGPPASRSAVEGLPTVVGGGGGEDVNCAVCKDDISADEKAKKLPCCHYYHEECILPWLGMRNTCPLCRYELPTDDVEYENRKARSNRGEDEEVRARYDFEMLSED